MILNKGDNVHYIAADGHIENGVVKEGNVFKDQSRVVYNCGGEWHRYEEYTSALTHHRDLRKGWNNNAINK